MLILMLSQVITLIPITSDKERDIDMKLEFAEQSVQYKMLNEAKYGKNGKSKTYQGVAQAASASDLTRVGEGIASLLGDELGSTYVVTRQAVIND